MIKSNSPYYIYTPFISANTGLTSTSYTLSVWVWDGLKSTPPVEATYKLIIKNIGNLTGNNKVNIARLVSDFIEFTPQKTTSTAVINGNNNQWIKSSVTYITTDPADATTPQEVTTSLTSLGYSYGIEGENVTNISDDTLITPQDYKVNRKGIFIVPILVSETANKLITIKSYPNLEINQSISALATTTSGELVKLIWVQLTETVADSYVEVIYNGKTTTLLIEDECKYTPVDVIFQNKEGSQQVITFFKENKYSLSVKSESFESDRGQPSEGNHQFVRYNVQGRGKITLNSGFVDEDMNDVFKELFLSERIWLYDGNFTPVNIKSKELTYKTRIKERLIDYETIFELSYNEINNI